MFCVRIKRLEVALGTKDLELTKIEKDYRFKSMKVVIANNKLKKGTILTSDDILLKCVSFPHPPTSIHRIEDAVNQELLVPVEPYQQITMDMIR